MFGAAGDSGGKLNLSQWRENLLRTLSVIMRVNRKARDGSQETRVMSHNIIYVNYRDLRKTGRGTQQILF